MVPFFVSIFGGSGFDSDADIVVPGSAMSVAAVPELVTVASPADVVVGVDMLALFFCRR